MKKQRLLMILPAMVMMVVLSGCYDIWHRVEGNHNVETEFRFVSSFNRIINEGDFEVYIKQDSIYELRIEAESNLIPLIRTSVKGSALVIDTHDNLKNHFPMKIYVTTPSIDELNLEGSGLISGQGLTTSEMEVNLSGSGSIDVGVTADKVMTSISGSGLLQMSVSTNELESTISGSGHMDLWGNANRGDFHISGSGTIQGYDLVQQECYASISGSGNMYIQVIEYLEVTISGSGSVYYQGNPQVVTHISGSGSVIHP
jgi:hypothetical protein